MHQSFDGRLEVQVQRKWACLCVFSTLKQQLWLSRIISLAAVQVQACVAKKFSVAFLLVWRLVFVKKYSQLNLCAQPMHQSYVNIVYFLKLVYQNNNELHMAFHNDSFKSIKKSNFPHDYKILNLLTCLNP